MPADEWIAFGIVPMACAVVGSLFDLLGVWLALILVSALTAGVIGRRRGYTLARATWFGTIGVIAFLVWSALIAPLAENLT